MLYSGVDRDSLNAYALAYNKLVDNALVNGCVLDTVFVYACKLVIGVARETDSVNG